MERVSVQVLAYKGRLKTQGRPQQKTKMGSSSLITALHLLLTTMLTPAAAASQCTPAETRKARERWGALRSVFDQSFPLV